ncbi:AMP-dependent synthetase and ligase [Chytridium lagenaria]|nr:AMP-dependent synthetase and ligase [Chytridium lagenaria]
MAQENTEWLIPPGRQFSHPEIRAILSREGSMFELEDMVIDGRPVRVFKSAPPDMRSMMYISRVYGDQEFMVLGKERITFEEFFVRVCKVSHALVKSGIKKGDRVAVLMKNCPEWIISFWAAISCGAIAVPVNGWLKPAEVEFILRDSASSLLLVDWERLVPILPILPGLAKSGLKSVIVARTDRIDARLVKAGIKLFADFEKTGGDEDSFPDVELNPDDDATLFYTSGTTGRPKGALGTHRNFVSNIMNVASANARDPLRRGTGIPATPPERVTPATLLTVPLFHATGCHAVMAGSVMTGGKLVMMEKWDPKVAMELIQKEKLSSFGGVPSMVWQFIEHPDVKKYDLSSVTSIFFGGAPVAPEIFNVIKKNLPNFKPSSSNGYGLTETSALAIGNFGYDYEQKPDSVGWPALSVEAKIVTPGTLDDVPNGVAGEIIIRGPNVVKGYWRNPEATKKAFTSDGWFISGDIGRKDEDGSIYILDRAKDMLIRGGENIYCVEVEDCIYSHEAVMDFLGEEVAAAVQIKPTFKGKVKATDIILHCQSRIAKFKCPIFIDIRNDPMPRNPNGKIMKNEVKKEVLEKAKRAGVVAKL